MGGSVRGTDVAAAKENVLWGDASFFNWHHIENVDEHHLMFVEIRQDDQILPEKNRLHSQLPIESPFTTDEARRPYMVDERTVSAAFALNSARSSGALGIAALKLYLTS